MFKWSLFYRRCLSGLIATIAFGSAAFGQEVYTTWSYSAKIILNTTASGANITSAVTNFPVLVRLTTANFAFSQSISGGADIRFSKADGTHLSYEIERWIDNSAADIWVKVDQILGNNATQYILMYWGKPGSSNQSSANSTFSSGDNFAGVWHLNNNPTGGTGAIKDATGNNNHGTTVGTMTASAQVNALVGTGLALDGTDDGISVADAASLDITPNLTIAGWFRADTLRGYAKMVAKSHTSAVAPYSMYAMGFDNAGHIEGEMSDAGTQYVVNGSTSLTVGTYYYATYTYDGSTLKVFLNGVQEGNSTAHSGSITANNQILSIGYSGFNADRFKGTIDEVQVSRVARSAEWIKLCYQNQKSNQTLVSIVANEDYSSWAHSMPFAINTTSSGAGIAAGQTIINFPLLLRLNPARFTHFSEVQANGTDIRFAKADGTPLSYEIERYVENGNNDTADIWVKVDTIIGNSSSQSITMYWGKTGVASKSNGAAVFDTSNLFVATYHLNESSGSAADVTVNALNGTRFGNTAQTAGIIGISQTFDGASDYFRTAAFDKGQFGSAFTMSGWVNISNSVATPGALWSKGDDNTSWNNGEVQFFFGDNTTNNPQQGRYPMLVGYSRNWINGNTALGTDAWHYLVYQYNPVGPVRALFIDGVSQTISNASFGGLDNSGNLFFIGRDISAEANNDFNGKMDEVVMSKTVRSADWIRLCYQNQKSGSTVVCSDFPAIITQPSDAQVMTGDSVTFAVTASGTNLTYQWQRGINGSNWSNVAVGVGATSPTYKFKTDSTVDKNAQFRCVVTACGGVISSAAKLTFVTCTGGTPVVTAQPSDAMVKAGDTATFTVAVSGVNPTYKWQRYVTSTGVWTDATVGIGATSPTYKFKTDSAADVNTQYHCVVTICGSVTSTAARLVFCGITSQPVTTTGVKVGDSAAFTIAVAGLTPAYQWQRSRSGGAWTDITGQTAAACKTKIDTVDTNSQYRCVVTTGCGSYTSATVRVTVCLPIAIVTQPGDQIGIPVGQTATFQVKASGYHLSYQWQRSGDGGTTWSLAAGTGTTNSTYSFLVAATDYNAKFRCRVWDTCASLSSAAATLTGCEVPAITVQPVLTLSVAESQNATFRVIATGTTLTYQWQRNGTNIPGATDSLYSFTAALLDNGIKFKCVVTGKCGNAISTEATLTVNAKVRANFSMKIGGIIDSIGPAPLTAQLTDLSVGAGSVWVWSYGDGTKDSSTSPGTIRNHLYDTTGVYPVKLIVRGPGGVDSMSRKLTVYSLWGNPIAISGLLVATDTSVQLDFMSFSSLNEAPMPPPTVAGIKLWYQPGPQIDTVNAKLLKSYSLSTLRTGGTKYTDNVKPDMQGSPFTVCQFMTQIKWNDSTVTTFASNNGCSVFMRDTVRPKNKLAVSGTYFPADTVLFSFDSLQTIDSVADSIGLWYGIGIDSIPDFSSRTNPNIQWWKASVVKAATGKFVYVKKNSQFNTDRKDLYFAVVIKSRTKVFSDQVKGKIRIGRDRPANPIYLRATAVQG